MAYRNKYAHPQMPEYERQSQMDRLGSTYFDAGMPMLGAGAGAIIGSTIAPGLGTAAGGLIGGAAGGALGMAGKELFGIGRRQEEMDERNMRAAQEYERKMAARQAAMQALAGLAR